MARVPTTIQELLAKLTGKAEDAKRRRDAAILSGDLHAQVFAAGEAKAYADAAETVRVSQNDADAEADG